MSSSGLTQMNMSQIYPASTHLVIGSPNRGKSTLAMSILHALRYAASVYVVNGSEETNRNYNSHIPLPYIYYDMTVSLLQSLIDIQKEATKNVGVPETHAERVEVFKKHGMVVIIDDQAHNAKIIESKALSEIQNNHRNLHMCIIYIVQKPMQVTYDYRMFDYVWATQNHTQNQQRLFTHYFPVFASNEFKRFQKIFGPATDNYGNIVINNLPAAKSDNPTENIHWFRANPDHKRRPFALGSRKYWRCAEKKVKEGLGPEWQDLPYWGPGTPYKGPFIG